MINIFSFNRELVVRVILDTLRSIPVPDVHHDLSRVLAIISRLGEDSGELISQSENAQRTECKPKKKRTRDCHENNDRHTARRRIMRAQESVIGSRKRAGDGRAAPIGEEHEARAR